MFIHQLDGRAPDQRSLLGGKALSLNKMVAEGLPVPEAFCITTEAFTHFLQANRLDPQDPEIAGKVTSAALPADLEADLRAAYARWGDRPVAVRSSAAAEDSAQSSYAGQFLTCLNLRGADAVIAAMRACWASYFNGAAQSYAKQRAEDSSAPLIAVVVQHMVDADIAGVLFTQDPMANNAQTMRIEAAWGVGEGLVSSQVSTDSYIVARDSLTLLSHTIRAKTMSTLPQRSGGIALVETPAHKIDSPTLSEDTACRLAGLADRLMRSAAYAGLDLDIEWAIQGDTLWILQARPITTLAQDQNTKVYADSDETDPERRENALFSRMDTGEIVTGLMSPLGLSFCRFYQNHIHGPAVKTMGLRKLLEPHTFMGYVRGHVYLNISASAFMLTQCPPTRDMRKFTQRYATDDVDLRAHTNPYGVPPKGLEYLRAVGHWARQQVHNLRTADKTAQAMVQQRKARTAASLALDLPQMSLPELNAELERIDIAFRAACAAYMPFFLQSFALYDALAETCQKLFKTQGKGLENRIKASLNNLRTIEVTRGIAALTETVRAQPALADLIRRTPSADLGRALDSTAEGRAFLTGAFKAFMEEFGSRGRQEFELTLPRWADDPCYIFDVIRLYLENPVDVDAIMAQSEALRGADTEALMASLSRKDRMKLRFIIKTYAKMADLRETVRPAFICETWFYRRIIVEVLGRLERQNILKQSDFPYIDFALFRDYVAGRKTAQEAFPPALIMANRRENLINLRSEEPPMALLGGYVPQPAESVKIAEDGQLNGMGASPGITVGTARVITDLPHQAQSFKKGEILVARFTDASWTPLFTLASGVITDIGSALSHSSIVAREFGIPAVVNTRTATAQIRTGDIVEIDGDRGIISVERQSAASPLQPPVDLPLTVPA
ncbi:PEP/pyruvate-binding domain-containing protein (plasmid) [Thioclava litoralis]|uniref:PEP/pyruvate-binding domain-containing protein n=1 Tax=Thioclava litoralis TaxID=3076557 RepID=A0ABZ1E3S9_9RHOB|nr:PEP/pyruvate-binding domain-containing protein [Thioclava sp. FTW29]